MNTTDLIKKTLYNLYLWNDKTKKEIETNKEHFIWFTHNINDTTYDIIHSSYGRITYNEKNKDYITTREDHLLPTDTIINSNTKKIEDYGELKSYGLINITPIKNENNKIAYFVDMNNDPLSAGFVIYHNEIVYHYYPGIKFKQDGEEVFLDLIPRNFDDNNFVPYIYKKGYADIAVCKEGYNTGMTLQGYIFGYKIKDINNNVDIDVSCSIPNSDTDIYPTFNIAILSYTKDITDVEINLSTDNPFMKYRYIECKKLVPGVKQAFTMIAEKIDRFGTNKEQDIKINSYLKWLYDSNAIIFVKDIVEYKINPIIKINNISRYLIPFYISDPVDLLYESSKYSSNNKYIGSFYNIATAQKILNSDGTVNTVLIVYFHIEIIDDKLNIKVQIQNPWFMNNEVDICISPKQWVNYEERIASEFFNENDIHLTLAPGKKVTIENK